MFCWSPVCFWAAWRFTNQFITTDGDDMENANGDMKIKTYPIHMAEADLDRYREIAKGHGMNLREFFAKAISELADRLSVNRTGD